MIHTRQSAGCASAACRGGALGLAVLFVSLILGTQARAATTVVGVTPSNMNSLGWFESAPAPCATDTGDFGFVTGPSGPPFGKGSVRLSTGPDGRSLKTLHHPGAAFGEPSFDELLGLSVRSFERPTNDARLWIFMMIEPEGTDSLHILKHEIVGADGAWQSDDAYSGEWTEEGFGTAMLAQWADPLVYGNFTIKSLYLGLGCGGQPDVGTAYFDAFHLSVDTAAEPPSDRTYNFEPPSLSIGNRSIIEGDGPRTANFRVSLESASTETVSVNYATADGTALAPSDYQSKSGTLTFPPGVTARTIQVNVNGDSAVEPHERFSVKLSGAQNATLADKIGVGTLRNDD